MSGLESTSGSVSGLTLPAARSEWEADSYVTFCASSAWVESSFRRATSTSTLSSVAMMPFSFW